MNERIRSLVASICLVLAIFTNINAQEILKVGEPAPELTITDWVHNQPDNTDLSNKVVVIDFWATWCGPCIKSVPHFNELQSEFKEEDKIVFLSMTDESPRKIQRTLERVDFQSAVVTDEEGKTQEALGIEAIPFAYIIAEDGKIAWTGTPEDLTKAIIQQVLEGEKIQPQEEKEEFTKDDTGFNQFTKLTKDPEIDTYFEMLPSTSNSVMKLGMLPKAYYQASVRLDEVFGEFLNLPAPRVQLPSDIADLHFDLYFIDKTTKKKKEAQERLQSKVLEAQGLQLKEETKSVEGWTIEIMDASKLRPSVSEFSSTSSAGSKVIFTNVPIEEMLLKLETEINHPMMDQSKSGKGYDFIIEVESKEKMKESLESYGLKIENKKMKLQFAELIRM